MKYSVIGALAFMTMFGYAQNKTTMKKATSVEMVIFKPKKNVSKEQLMQAMRATNEIIKDFDGFISRSTSLNEKGEFLDVVYWENKALALAAAQKVQEIPMVLNNFALIDPQSIKMEHFDIFAIQE